LNNTGQFGGTSGIDINAPEAWDITTGCNNIRIAVLDDGVEDHDDLDGRVLNGYTHLDSLGLGRPASVCMEVLPSVYQRVGHGMACTGIMAASFLIDRYIKLLLLVFKRRQALLLPPGYSGDTSRSTFLFWQGFKAFFRSGGDPRCIWPYQALWLNQHTFA
jgi:subtilisin family serine protease